MESLLNSINTRLNYIINHTDNNFIIKTCNVISEKLKPIKQREIKTEKLLNNVCNEIINRDIARMKSVINIDKETKTVVRKMDELTSMIEQIKASYFADTAN